METNLLRDISLPNLKNLASKQFGLPRRFSMRNSFRMQSQPMFVSVSRCSWMQSQTLLIASRHSAFPYSIFHIIFVSAEKKMPRIDATRIITLMTNQALAWNRAESQFPRHSMCQKMRIMPISFSAEESITFRRSISSPKPTAVRASRLVDFGPESLGQCPMFSRHHTPFKRVTPSASWRSCLGTSVSALGVIMKNPPLRYSVPRPLQYSTDCGI